MKQLAYDYLMRDELVNIDVLEALHLPKAQIRAANDHGVLVEHDGLYFFASEPGCAAEFLPQITQGLTKDEERQIVLHSGELREMLEHQFGFQTEMECYNATYRSKHPIAYALPQGAEIRTLDAQSVDFIHAHYHMVDDVNYIRERIEDGMFGAFVQNEIAGFVGTHVERSMGLLEVLPEFRRLGLAYCLEAHMINHLLAQGRVPYCQVAIVNEASIRLQTKLGLTISDNVVYWLAHHRAK